MGRTAIVALLLAAACGRSGAPAARGAGAHDGAPPLDASRPGADGRGGARDASADGRTDAARGDAAAGDAARPDAARPDAARDAGADAAADAARPDGGAPPCAEGATRPCGSDVGACVAGHEACAGGAWGTCQGGVGPAAEGCNAVDDDCDGQADEGCACAPGAVLSCGSAEGACALGAQTCGADGAWGPCLGGTGPAAETCNGVDEDCDGVADDGEGECGGVCGLAGEPGAPCAGGGAGACGVGVWVCDGPNAVACSDGAAVAESCNGLDDDCDGEIDEGFGLCAACCDSGDADLCNDDKITCAGCVDAGAALAESCNGLDDDCDGVADDGVGCFQAGGEPVAPVVTDECGAGFYQYATPAGASANPSPDVRESGKVIVLVHEGPSGCGGTTIAVIADDIADGSGGTLRMTWTSDPATGVGVLVSDDGNECMYGPVAGGRCNWTWQPCCTDGVLIGTYAGDFCVTLSFSLATGVDEVRVLDGAGGGYQAYALDEPVTLCRTTIPAIP